MRTIPLRKVSTTDERISASLSWHYRQDRIYRDKLTDILRSYAGRTTYPEHLRDADLSLIGDKRELINLTYQFVESYTLAMAANRPRALFTSPFPESQPFAAHFQRNMDRYMRQLSLESVFQQVVRDGCLMLGIAYVHDADSLSVNPADPAGRYAGQPFVSRIALKHFVRDVEGDSPEECQWMGHMYSIPYRQAIRDRRFPQWARAMFKEHGPDDSVEEGESQLTGGERLEDVLNFCTVYVTSRHELRTYWIDATFQPRSERAVQRIACRTTKCPYHFLNFGPVPDEFWPSSPALNLQLLNDFTNALYRKLQDQAYRQKQLLVGAKADKADLQAVADAEDGDGLGLDNPASAQMQRFDGPDQNLFGMLMNALQQYSRAAGNLDSRLGLGPSADTASQERMVGAMASRLEAYQQQRFVSFARNVIRDLAKLVYEHPTLKIPGAHRVGFLDVDDSWRPGSEMGSREADFDVLHLDIDPYSMAYKSPQERAMEMDGDFNLFAPVFQLFAQQGIQFDLKAFIEERARLKDAPYLTRLWKYDEPPQQLDAAGGGPKPQREYVHRNVSGGQDPMQAVAAIFQSPGNN